ncbi:MAG: NAD(P)-dependent oxidoreductase [Candidatus Melainabacteria bacterium]|nr:NAD(P)-dependent oxidoreductase [Candidatus Melainabacteria bacterium]
MRKEANSDNRGELPRVAFLGMGIMGAAMAANLARDGYPVLIWNRSAGSPGAALAAAAGAEVAPDLAGAVRDREIIFSCLGDEKDVASVLGDLVPLASRDSLVVDMTTIGPSAARELAVNLESAGLRFLDAPVTGGDIGAREGTLTIMVGGRKEDFDAALPILRVMGKTVEYCGPSGSGQALKLCNQVLCAVNMIGVCEALTLAGNLGLEERLVVDTLGGGAGGSWALSNLGRRIVNGDLGPGFMLRHMIKDLRLIEENAAVELPGTEMARNLFQRVSDSVPGADRELGTQAMISAYSRPTVVP